MCFPMFALKCGGEVDWEENLKVFQQKGMCLPKWGQDAIIQKGFLLHDYILPYSLVWNQKEPLTSERAFNVGQLLEKKNTYLQFSKTTQTRNAE